MNMSAKNIIRRITPEQAARAFDEPTASTVTHFKVRFATPHVAPNNWPPFAYILSGIDAMNVIYTAIVVAETQEDACAAIINTFDMPSFLRVEVDCKPEFGPDDAMAGASIRGVTHATKPRGLLSSIFLFWK